MIRNLKALLGAAMALAAFGALGASGAQAAEFHCSVEPCKVTMGLDGTGKTAHHVLVIKKGAFSASTTCNSLTGEGTSNTKTFKELTVTNLVYSGCSAFGSALSINMNGCDYLFNSSGTLTIQCPVGKVIEESFAGCTITIGAQGPLNGVTYTNLGAKQEITMQLLVKGIKGVAHAGCKAILGFEGEFTEGEYTTGNSILTSETDPGGVMANLWWE